MRISKLDPAVVIVNNVLVTIADDRSTVGILSAAPHGRGWRGRVLLGYARADTRERLERQVAAVRAAGVAREDMYADLAVRRTDRHQYGQLLLRAGHGDVVMVETLAPLGLTISDTLGLIRDWGSRGVGVRTLVGPILINTSDADSPATQHTLGILQLIEDLYDAYVQERVEVNRCTARAQGRSLGRQSSSATRLSQTWRL